MGNNDKGSVAVQVWGDCACFTRPETKVERVSYPVPTPSAARGILEAILWKPEMRYEVRNIRVLRPLKWISMMRNELKSKTSFVVAQKSVYGSGDGYYAEDDRTQRNTLALKDVAYTIHADIYLEPHAMGKYSVKKYVEQFNRRTERGECFKQPCFGMKEFMAYFAPVDDSPAFDLTMDCGVMLGEMKYAGKRSGIATPLFIRAKIDKGVFTVPEDIYIARRESSARESKNERKEVS